MATLNFPDAPDTGDTYTDSNSGFTYEWNGTVWISKDPSTASNIKEIDNISSSFNGSTTAFTLQVAGVNIEPVNAQQLIISVGGVMQNAGDDFTVSGSTLTFTTAPTSGLTFFGTYLGTALSLNTVADSTVSASSFEMPLTIGAAADSTTIPGNAVVSGILTAANAYVTGILTAQTLNYNNVTDIYSSGIITATRGIQQTGNEGLHVTAGITTVGILTATSARIGLGVTINNTGIDAGIGAGIVTAGNIHVALGITAQNAGSTGIDLRLQSGATWGFRSNPTSGDNSYGLDIFKGAAATDVKASIDSNGNLGIGTDDPQRKLEVWDASESNIRIEGGADYFELRVKDSDDAFGIHKNIAGAGSAEVLSIDANAGFNFSNGALVEKVKITAGRLSDNTNIDLENGMVHYFTTAENTTSTPNIRINSSTSLNSGMSSGDCISVTLVTTAAAAGYSANLTIDGVAVTEEWVGGSAPSEGSADGLDIYTYTIICIHNTSTGDSGFKVIANLTNATN